MIPNSDKNIQPLIIPLKQRPKDVLLFCLLTSIRMYSTAGQSREYLHIYLNESPRKEPKTSHKSVSFSHTFNPNAASPYISRL